MRQPLRIVAVVLSAVLALAGAAAMAASDFEAGEKAWEKRDFLTAFKILIPLAIEGHSGAQYLVGNMYLSVRWFGGDACRAVVWYEKAARGRHADAQDFLARAYDQGLAVKPDHRKAYMWALAAKNSAARSPLKEVSYYAAKLTADERKAIEAAMKSWRAEDEPPAEFYPVPGYLLVMPRPGKFLTRLGLSGCEWPWPRPTAKPASSPSSRTLEEGEQAYENGDYAGALEIILPLAVDGNARAQALFGKMLDYQQGVPDDECAAVAWHDKAARQGHAEAQALLAMSYLTGLGVRKDRIQAYTWMLSAKRSGSQFAKEHVDSISLNVPEDKKVELESGLAGWWPKDQPPADLIPIPDLVKSLLRDTGVLEPYGASVCW